jgi:hypothetical protein
MENDDDCKKKEEEEELTLPYMKEISFICDACKKKYKENGIMNSELCKHKSGFLPSPIFSYNRYANLLCPTLMSEVLTIMVSELFYRNDNNYEETIKDDISKGKIKLRCDELSYIYDSSYYKKIYSCNNIRMVFNVISRSDWKTHPNAVYSRHNSNYGYYAIHKDIYGKERPIMFPHVNFYSSEYDIDVSIKGVVADTFTKGDKPISEIDLKGVLEYYAYCIFLFGIDLKQFYIIMEYKTGQLPYKRKNYFFMTLFLSKKK